MPSIKFGAKRARLEVRLSEKQKALFEEAAALSGCDLSQFVISSLQKAAEETIRNRRVIELTEADTEMLVRALLNPPEPNEAMHKAFRLADEYFGRQR